jgi:DNA-binding transcriptional MocR family regulator
MFFGQTVQAGIAASCIYPENTYIRHAAVMRNAIHTINTIREPIYQKLANLLEGMIHSHSLRPGDRVPSVREFSRQQRVSVPTALNAFATLETRGLIEARPRSGFYVRARQADMVREPKGAATPVKVTDFANVDPFDSLLADQSNPKFVALGAAVPNASLLPAEKLARIIGVIARRHSALGVGYDMPPGSETLRRELARRSLEWGCSLRSDDFIVTNGGTEAISLALRATCKPGDTVAVESPTYYGLVGMLRQLGLNALPIPSDSSHGMDPDALRRALRRTRVSACALIPNFNNPTGSLMPDDNKKQILELLAGRKIPIVEDDIFGDLNHEGARPRCLKSFDRDGTVLLCSSFSKTLAPGYRVGFIAAGRWHRHVMSLKQHSSLGGATLPALAIAEFLRNGGYNRYLRSLRQSYRHQVAQMREAVVETFPKAIGLSRPQGGFILWCELPANVNSLELFKRARAAGISIAPGPLFSPQGGHQNFIRIHCGHPWDARIERSIGILGHLACQLAS